MMDMLEAHRSEAIAKTTCARRLINEQRRSSTFASKRNEERRAQIVIPAGLRLELSSLVNLALPFRSLDPRFRF